MEALAAERAAAKTRAPAQSNEPPLIWQNSNAVLERCKPLLTEKRLRNAAQYLKDFPKPMRLGERRNCKLFWRLDQIVAWVNRPDAVAKLAQADAMARAAKAAEGKSQSPKK